MQFKHASLLLLVVLLGTGILTAIVLERQRELDAQREAILRDIGEPIDLDADDDHANGDVTKTPAQNIDPESLKENQYLSTTIDLNGDGTMENVSIDITGNRTEGTTTTIVINGTSSVFPGGNPEGFFGIVDIDTSDSEKEVAVSDMGPSGDYTTGFYRWDGTSIQYVGTVQGLYGDIDIATLDARFFAD